MNLTLKNSGIEKPEYILFSPCLDEYIEKREEAIRAALWNVLREYEAMSITYIDGNTKHRVIFFPRMEEGRLRMVAATFRDGQPICHTPNIERAINDLVNVNMWYDLFIKA